MTSQAATSAVISLSFLIGCSEPTFVPVAGKVTLDGKPLSYVTLKFMPETSADGQFALGETDENGKYSLITVNPAVATHEMGVLAGAYHVTVVRIPRWPPQRTQAVPLVYSSERSTPVVCHVPRAGGICDIALTSAAVIGEQAAPGTGLPPQLPTSGLP